VIQAGSIPFDATASVDKAIALMTEARDNGAEIAVFPEAFIGGYPKGSTFGAPVGLRTDDGRRQYQRYSSGAVALDGPEVERLAEAAREVEIFVVIGIIERLGNTLCCTALMLDPEAGIAGAHRKLMPTGSERLIWGFGDGSTLDTMDTPLGRVGSVICWENYMPLLRQAIGLPVHHQGRLPGRPSGRSRSALRQHGHPRRQRDRRPDRRSPRRPGLRRGDDPLRRYRPGREDALPPRLRRRRSLRPSRC